MVLLDSRKSLHFFDPDGYIEKRVPPQFPHLIVGTQTLMQQRLPRKHVYKQVAKSHPSKVMLPLNLNAIVYKLIYTHTL